MGYSVPLGMSHSSSGVAFNPRRSHDNLTKQMLVISLLYDRLQVID